MGSCVIKQEKPKKCSLVSSPLSSKVEFSKSKKKLGIHSEYSFTQIIGHGQFGTVRAAVKKSDEDKKTIAIKSIPKKNFSNNKPLRREFKIMTTIDHPNIVRLIDAYEDQLYLHLVMEMCTGGNIFERIVQQGPYSEVKASVVMKQLLEAVDYLHSNNIAHRDLKPENLLYTSPDSETIKLCDFGTSIKSSEKRQLISLVGTPYYLAPEIIERSYSKSCDVWSLGIILYFLLIGKHPFRGKTAKTVFQKASGGFTSVDLSEYSHLSHHVKDLLQKMLNPNDRRRISSKLALEHSWFLTEERKSGIFDFSLDLLKKINADRKVWNIFLDVLIRNLKEEQVDVVCEELGTINQDGVQEINAEKLAFILRKCGFDRVADDLDAKVCEIEGGFTGEVNLNDFGKVLKEVKKLDVEESFWIKSEQIGFKRLPAEETECLPIRKN
jgi:calcium-dependent protein kinase